MGRITTSGWHLGGSQSDIAHLKAQDIDWTDRTIGYNRMKLEGRAVKPVLIHFGGEVAAILRDLPKMGQLFPYLANVRPAHRAAEFKQRCQGLKIQGVTLHSYRYAWAVQIPAKRVVKFRVAKAAKDAILGAK